MSKMILYIVSNLESSEITNQLYNILRNINRREFRPKIITLLKEPEDSVYEDFERLKIDIYSLGLSRTKLWLKGKRILAVTCEELQPDIIHTIGYDADILAVKYLSKFKHCSTICNFPYEEYTTALGKIIGKIRDKRYVKYLFKMNCPIVSSYSLRRKLKECYDVNAYTIPNGVDEIYFSPVDKLEISRRREKLGLDTTKRIFISIASMSKIEDPLTIINAFQRANISNFATLVLLGYGPLLKKCKKYNSEGIVIKGKVDNLREFLKCANIFISSSKSEKLSVSVLQALNCGLPVILSDTKCHREILNKDNTVGNKFSVGSISELKEYFRYYTRCSLEYKSKKARIVGETFYGSKIICSIYERMYTQIISQGII
ncbi:glycosyl transferase family 1 [Clostridium carboxidivorans P7]|uniref:Glycosyl transferase group 1 n=1 Tax=Clostridium carboxidivorans P7 TaxID=536227 RepID=C6PQG6_9CLOT|nr:glycosyltransferase [Clostridium carboxidivorans]AKN30442.1 glycosyl transferase family 1 [Clostridium carboxidivorans P7]EET88488.1 glycosyl transferase group 1 [Clostridium carboxidivorans P7]EFG86183.1 glycosyltransferase, group 1 family protein [Clostridium carboxidivorans P7]